MAIQHTKDFKHKAVRIEPMSGLPRMQRLRRTPVCRWTNCSGREVDVEERS